MKRQQPVKPGQQPDAAKSALGEELAEEEWADDAGETAEGEEWADEAVPGRPTTAPKETPAYATWIAGAVGLVLGLVMFRSCG